MRTLLARIADNIAPTRLGRSFRWLLSATLVNNIGDGIAIAAGPLLVASLTRDPFLVSLALLSGYLPVLIFGVVGGAAADRFDRRRMVIAVDLVRAGVLVVLVIVALVVGIIYVARNKDTWRAKGRHVVAEGRNFGTNTDNQGCLDESIARYKKETGHLSAISTNLFMGGCLESSRPTPGFCDKVPVGDMMKLGEWRAEQCRHYDLGNDLNCKYYLFIPVPMFCGEQKRTGNQQ